MAKGQKATPRSEWSERRKQTQNAWNSSNRAVAGTNIPTDLHEQFKSYCAAKGTTVSAELAAYIRRCVEEGVGAIPDGNAGEEERRD